MTTLGLTIVLSVSEIAYRLGGKYGGLDHTITRSFDHMLV